MLNLLLETRKIRELGGRRPFFGHSLASLQRVLGPFFSSHPLFWSIVISGPSTNQNTLLIKNIQLGKNYIPIVFVFRHDIPYITLVYITVNM